MEGMGFASTRGCFYQQVLGWSQWNCRGDGRDARAALGLLAPENEMAERRVGLYPGGILGSDPAVQTLNPSEPGAAPEGNGKFRQLEVCGLGAVIFLLKHYSLPFPLLKPRNQCF